MKVQIDCSIYEMTNGFLDNLSFSIECDITVFIDDNNSVNVPFDSERHKILIEDSGLPEKIKKQLSKDDILGNLVYDVIYKTISKLNVSYSETKTINKEGTNDESPN